MNTVKRALPAVPVRLQTTFRGMLPRIERHARVYFRNVKDTNRKADYIQETIALSWKWLLRLDDHGKGATQFVSTLATFAARAVRSGRRLCGQEKAQDVLSPRAQQRHGFAVGKLPDFATLHGNPLEEALQDNTRSPVPEAAAFRIDFPAWRRTHSRRNRRLLDRMAQGSRTRDARSTVPTIPRADFSVAPALPRRLDRLLR